MRIAMVFVAMLALSACGDGEKTVVIQPDPPAQTVVVPAEQPPALVVPQGAKVICPNGTAAVYVEGVYHC